VNELVNGLTLVISDL